jgi:hypothetical protein
MAWCCVVPCSSCARACVRACVRAGDSGSSFLGAVRTMWSRPDAGGAAAHGAPELEAAAAAEGAVGGGGQAPPTLIKLGGADNAVQDELAAMTRQNLEAVTAMGSALTEQHRQLGRVEVSASQCDSQSLRGGVRSRF